MATIQEIYEAGRDAAYARVGDHHGYSGLVGGVSAVLASRGVVAEPRELSGDFHSQFVGMADLADKATVQDIVRYFDSQLHFSSVLPYEVEKSSSFHAPYSYGGAVDTAWIANEIDEKLRKDKIRRGSKKYKEFVEKNSRKIVDAVREEVRKKADRQAASQREWADRNRGEVEKVERSEKHLARAEEILVALSDAAGVEPRQLGKLRERREVYRRAVETMRSSLAQAMVPVEFDEQEVQYALERPAIKPFADALGKFSSSEKANAAGYVLSSGARARSRSAAHRRSRTRGHLGASVNRAGV